MTTPRRIVLTREQEQCRAWRRPLESRGVEVLCLPLIRFATLTPPAGLDASFDWILFRSPQAVRAFWDSGCDAGDAKLGALGFGTADALRACGRVNDLDGRPDTGAAMAAVFLDAVAPPARVLLPGPARPLAEPGRSLKAAGFDVLAAPLYRTEPVPPAELPEAPWRDGDLIFFASPSAVRACAAAWGAPAPCVAIGETTAAAAREAGFAVAVAAEPTLESMITAAGPPAAPPRTTESTS